jgi:phage replication-related protein YjqB (UPF0714/DUF867 family)
MAFEMTAMRHTSVSRYALVAALVLAGVAAAWAQAPVAENQRAPGRLAEVGGPSFAGLVTLSLPGQRDLVARREHCSIDPDRLRAIGREVGQQVRIEREGVGAVLFTVSEAHDESAENSVRAGKMGRARFGPADEFSARVFARVSHPTLSDADARRLGEFVERSDDDGIATGLLVLAPHGGEIERHTDAQAERLAATLRAVGKPSVTTWRCKGYDLPTTLPAFVRWHITSTDTHESSFPLLAQIARRRFSYAVSFHGMTREAVLIGGGGPESLKRALQDEITRALDGSGIPVLIAAKEEANSGFNPENIVNRYCPGTGVQIEQSSRARRDHWRAIADSVARVYAPRL